MRVAGVDFTSAPSRRKPIVVATGRLSGGALAVVGLDTFDDWPPFEAWLASGPWVAAFDFPFGLPREFVASLGWPSDGPQPWAEVVRRVAALGREVLVAHCRAFCAARPAGRKFAHRATDLPAGSSPSMKWVNPPVVLMLHAGAPRLLASGATIPGLHEDGDPARVALEGYPGLLARSVLGRASYKSDDPRKDDGPRRAARERLVAALEAGRHALAVPVDFGGTRDACLDERSGDRLDAVLCAVQAAWGWQRRMSGYGLPEAVDPLEGWIVGA